MPGGRDVWAIGPDDTTRQRPFAERHILQQQNLDLPAFATTTIGSFPQTSEVRTKRAAFRAGKITREEYERFLESEIERNVRFQEEIGIDVLVHGEPERNDMVQYFGEQLTGFIFTEKAWVQMDPSGKLVNPDVPPS